MTNRDYCDRCGTAHRGVDCPARALAEVIREAAVRWQKLNLGSMAACNASPGDCDTYIAAAVAAHLQSDEAIARAATATAAWQNASNSTKRRNAEGDMRAAITALLEPA